MGSDPQDSSASRDDRLFRLNEELQAALERGELHEDSVWALRFDLEPQVVARARRAIEMLAGDLESPVEFEELPAPALPDDYVLEEELGRGGMGVVYRVHQKSLDRHLALKVLRPGEVVARRALERFKREARSLARLRHPHIASVHEVGEWEGRIYFTMDLIEGRSLADHIAEKEVTPTQAVRWMRQVTSAIQYVHSHGLVHRDIKPANILIDEKGDACVVDFGLARDVEVSSDLTMSGHFLGTPAYMSPEQARGQGEQVGESTDVYAIGAVFYECLCGQRAFQGTSIVEIISAVCEGQVKAPSRIEPKVPQGLERICLKAMSTSPEDRYVTARALLEDFERFEAGKPVMAEPPSFKSQWRNFFSRHRSTVKTSFLTVVALLLLFFLFVWPLLPSEAESQMRSARVLQEEGQSRAAVELYDRSYPENPDLDEVRSHTWSYSKALLESSDELQQSGKSEEAAALARRCTVVLNQALTLLAPRRRQSQSSQRELNTLRMRLRFLTTSAAARSLEWIDAVSAIEDLDREIESHSIDSLDASIPESIFGFKGSPELWVASGNLKKLGDESVPGHSAAVELWSQTLRNDHSVVRGGTESKGAHNSPSLLVSLLMAADAFHKRGAEHATPVLDAKTGPNWMGWVLERNLPRLREELAVLAVDESLGPVARRAARDFISDLLDFPASIGQRLSDSELESMAQGFPEGEQRGLAGKLRLISIVLAREPEAFDESVGRWLRGRVPAGGFRLPAGTAADWASWCDSIDTASLSEGFGRALGVDGELEDMALLLEHFDRSASGSERRRWHQLFGLLAPPLASTPLWPRSRSSSQEPERLAMAWHRVLRGDAQPERWRVHLAGWHWAFGELHPVQRWSESIEVAEGEAFHKSWELPSDESSGLATWFAGLGGLSTASELSPVKASIHGWVGARPGGSGLWFESPSSPSGPEELALHLPGQGVVVTRGQVASAGLMEWGPNLSLDQNYELVLGRLEPVEGTSAPWSLDDWVRALSEEADSLSRALSDESMRPRGLTAGMRRARAQQLAWLGCLLSLEDGRASFMPLIREWDQPGSPGEAYWQRWVIDSKEQAHRTEALRALHLKGSFHSFKKRERLALARLARDRGASLGSEEAAALRRDDEERASRGRQMLALKIIGGFLGFMLFCGLIAGIPKLVRFVRSGEFRRRRESISREERLMGAVAMMPGGLWWLWYADFQGSLGSSYSASFHQVGLLASFAWYAVMFAYLGKHLASRLRWLPALCFGAAGIFSLLELTGVGLAAWSWPTGPAGWLFLVGLLGLPVAVRELWDWQTDAARSRVLRRRSQWVFCLLVLLPVALRVLGFQDERFQLSGGSGLAFAFTFYLSGLIGMTTWILLLLAAMKPKRKLIEQRVRERQAEARRARLAAQA